MNLLLTIITDQTEETLIKKAMDKHINVNGASKMYLNKKDIPKYPQFLFSFGGVSLAEIPKVIRLLYSCWF